MSTDKQKMEYYEKRAQDRIQQSGRYLNDAIKAHNQVGALLQDATNFLNLAAGLAQIEVALENLPEPNKVEAKNAQVPDDKV